MPVPNVGQREAAAWEVYVGTKPNDAIHDEYSQLERMERSKAFKGFTGGKAYIGTIEYRLNTSVKPITDTETLDTTRVDVFDEFEYDGKQYAGDYVISTKEEAENRGSAAKFDLDKGKSDNLLKSLRSRINADICGAQSGNEILGLQDLVSATPTTGSPGAVDRSVHTFWRNQQVTGTQSTSAFDNLRASMRTIHAAASKGMGVMEPEYYLSTSTVVNGYESLLVANEFVSDKRDSGQVDAGIDHDAMRFKKARVVWDRDVLADTMYALNNENLLIAYQTDFWMKAYGKVRPGNQLVDILAVETQCALISNNPRHLGVITAIS
jgi:hypothetical protein